MANDSIDTGKPSWRLAMSRPRRKLRRFRGHEGNSSTERAKGKSRTLSAQNTSRRDGQWKAPGLILQL